MEVSPIFFIDQAFLDAYMAFMQLEADRARRRAEEEKKVMEQGPGPAPELQREDEADGR
ncbi:hypothetical protein HY374_00110 [Candidatus Berkelbacteria bacterium]|nr:hypothetical protein [Candidatus Berkelbacteria bacterium]